MRSEENFREQAMADFCNMHFNSESLLLPKMRALKGLMQKMKSALDMFACSVCRSLMHVTSLSAAQSQVCSSLGGSALTSANTTLLLKPFSQKIPH